MNEETSFDPNEVKNEPLDNEAENIEETALEEETFDEEQNAPAAEEASDNKKKKGLKTAGIAGASGVVGAAIGVLTPANLFPDACEIEGECPVNVVEPQSEPALAPAPAVTTPIHGNDMEVATSVNDSMSFNQAFAAARHEIGPGGLFVWHGHTYGTYYANEWDAMTPEDRDQYWADVYHTTAHIEYEPTQLAETPEPTEPIEPLEPTEHETVQTEPETLQIPEENVIYTVDVNDDGHADVVIAQINPGEDPDLVMDTNGDGKFDTLVLDPQLDDNDELVVDPDNIHEIPDMEIIPKVPEETVDPVASPLVVSDSEIYEDFDTDGDGQVDTMVLDADGNSTLDVAFDTTGDGKMDTLVLDPSVDAEGNLVIDEGKVSPINGVIITSDKELENPEGTIVADNQDIDEFSDVTTDPDITIDNDMGMDDFVG